MSVSYEQGIVSIRDVGEMSCKSPGHLAEIPLAYLGEIITADLLTALLDKDQYIS